MNFCQRILLRALLIVSSVLVLASCAELQQDSAEGATKELDDAISQASSREGWVDRLTTQDAVLGLQAKWFCSFYSEDAYISRSILVLGAGGAGTLDNQPLSWDVPEPTSMNLALPTWRLNVSDIVFSHRLSIDDHFEGAILSSNSRIACDWSGAYRPGAKLLADIDDQIDSSVDNLEFYGAVEPLTSTYENGSIAWSCDVYVGSVLVDRQDYKFMPNGNGFSVFDFQWNQIAADSIRLEYGEISFEINDIEFSGFDANTFSARDSRGYHYSCSRYAS